MIDYPYCHVTSSNAGYGRYILRNSAGLTDIEGAGANLTSSSFWTKKVLGKKISLNDVLGIGITKNGSNTDIKLWINGVDQGVVFSVNGDNIDFRPLTIFTISTSALKSTYYQCGRTLEHLPAGYSPW